MRSIQTLALSSAFALVALLGACASSAPPPFNPPAPVTSWIVNGEGAPIGRAMVREGPGGVLVRLAFDEGALPAGWHGVHVHAIGDCSDAASGFHVSGVHEGFGDETAHGLANPAGPEDGDFPNLYAPASGAFGAEFYNERLTLTRDDNGRGRLLDADGSALVIHAGPDDQESQPIGGAGARLACAAFRPMP